MFQRISEGWTFLIIIFLVDLVACLSEEHARRSLQEVNFDVLIYCSKLLVDIIEGSSINCCSSRISMCILVRDLKIYWTRD
ncbi:hypothetical protein DsansV1_C15g0138781 [Dioscorea sansibarensis]